MDAQIEGLGQNSSSELVLVGKLLTSRVYNFNTFCSDVKSVLNPRKGIEIQKLGEDRILFKFFHVIDKNRALEGCPWSFDKYILILNGVNVDESPLLANLDMCSFYMRIHDLPLSRQTPEMARAIGNKMGIFEELDPNEAWGASMRVRVRINVLKPLMRCMRLRGPQGQELMVSFTYERLPTFCYLCGIMGHMMKECDTLYDMGVEFKEIAELPYGPWLREKPSKFNGPRIFKFPGRDDQDRANSTRTNSGNSDMRRGEHADSDSNRPHMMSQRSSDGQFDAGERVLSANRGFSDRMHNQQPSEEGVVHRGVGLDRYGMDNLRQQSDDQHSDAPDYMELD